MTSYAGVLQAIGAVVVCVGIGFVVAWMLGWVKTEATVALMDDLAAEKVQAMFAQVPDFCYPEDAVVIKWGVTGIGWGETTFWVDGSKRKIICDNEGMSKDFIKERLCSMVDACELRS